MKQQQQQQKYRPKKIISDTDGCEENKKIHPHFIFAAIFIFLLLFKSFTGLGAGAAFVWCFFFSGCLPACMPGCQSIQCIIILSHSCFTPNKNKRKKFSMRFGLNLVQSLCFLIYLIVNCAHSTNFYGIFTIYLFRCAFPLFLLSCGPSFFSLARVKNHAQAFFHLSLISVYWCTSSL